MPFDLRIIGALVLALALAGTHWAAYRTGRALVAGEWAEDRAEATGRMVRAEQDARAKEQELNTKVRDVSSKFSREKALRAADADAAAGELQLLQAAIASAASGAASAAGRDDGAGTGQLLLACAGEHQAMAKQADAIAINLTGLQSYVSSVCKP